MTDDKLITAAEDLTSLAEFILVDPRFSLFDLIKISRSFVPILDSLSRNIPLEPKIHCGILHKCPKCDEALESNIFHYWKYCPNCGQRILSEDDINDDDSN